MLAAFLLLSLLPLALLDLPPRPHSTKQRKSAPPAPPPAPPLQRERKPNIVLVLTDDQDVELGSLNFMPHTLEHVRDRGAQFMHAYVTTPMCCPSRSSLLTGMYVHNHHVYTNNDNCSSSQWQAQYETRSFATYLSNAGYRTGYFGKYLNKYNGSYVPPGWREWGGLIMNSKYYNYSINMNGKKIKHGFDYQKDYYPDLIANDSIAFLRQSKKNSAHKPVMLTMSFPAPHGPEDSAPQYSHLFFNVTTHHTPSYDYAPNPDKQWILQVTQKMQPIHKQFTDLLMTKRLQTLQSVDAAVKLVVDELRALGELDNTYIFYTSDHGYHLGQFGLIKGKSFPFEFDVRIPFLVRGPGVEPGMIVDDIVLNIDLAPTFLDIAGVEPPPHMDGRSVLPLFVNSKRKRMKWPDTFLIESSGRRETPFLDARSRAPKRPLTTEAPPTTRSSTDTPSSPRPHHEVTTSSFRRIYESAEEVMPTDDEDLEEDIEDDIDEGYEGDEEDAFGNDTTLFTSKNIIRDELLPELYNKVIEDEMYPNRNVFHTNKLERLRDECSADELRLPCKINQKWYCVNDNGRWRKHKCKMAAPVNYTGSKGFKKCACFTADGLVYRRIPLKNITRRHTRRTYDPDLSHILFHRLPSSKKSPRYRRDTIRHVDTAMRNVRGRIYDLRNASEPGYHLQHNDLSAGCLVLADGKVNCTNSVYNDRRSWRQSRHQIDNEIHQLKQKLEQLKEIRRHLKHKRPTPILEETETEETIIEESERHGKKRKRPRVEIMREVTTEGIDITGSKHHRHNHGITITTQGYDEVATSTRSEEELLPSTNKPHPSTPAPSSPDVCQCETSSIPAHPISANTNRIKEAKRRLKEEKLRKKLRKQRRKDQMDRQCSSERMNCFHHDSDHWKTAPLWTHGPFCFCMNANNNTYSCVRTINATHNFLYCEFTTGLVTYYNIRVDPFELQNRADLLKPEEKALLHDQLMLLMACKGRGCTMGLHSLNGRGKTVGGANKYKKKKLVEQYGAGVGGVQLVGTHGVRTSTKGRNSTASALPRQVGIRTRRKT